jgi:hypothetical protein
MEHDVTHGDDAGGMVTVDQERSASLLVRVWSESGTDGFRARLTSVDTAPGAGGAEMTVGVASSPADVLALVGTWLNTFLGPGTSIEPGAS